jgi:hypothetical protein
MVIDVLHGKVTGSGRSGKKEAEMKPMMTGCLAAMLLGGVPVTALANTGSEEWFRAKFGRPSPSQQARLNDDAASTAWREAPSAPGSVLPHLNDQWFRAKFGRYSPAEEARRQAELANTAYRNDPATGPVDRRSERRLFMKAKYGRDLAER